MVIKHQVCIQLERIFPQFNCQYGHFWTRNKNNLQHAENNRSIKKKVD